MTEDNKSETGQEVQETGQTVHHHHQQQPSLKDTGSGSPRSQNEPYLDDSPTSTKPTRTQVARETMETYNNYRNKRKTKDHNWWGSKHHEPERGDPDREFQFARNMPVSNQEIKDVQQAYDAKILDPFTGKPDPLVPHLRPTTPPMEKAEKQIKGLEDQGVNVTPELREEVTHQFISNNGIHAALLIWCRNKKDVPVQYVNEFIKSMDRLKLEMATQQRDVTEKLGQAIKDCEEKESRCQQLQTENSKLEMEVQRLKEETEKLQQEEKEKTDIQNEPSAGRRCLQNRVKELELQVQNLKEELRASNDGMRVQGKANYTTVDSRIDAVRKENKGTDEEEAPNLVDRINYLNLVCFFRTRNYLQLPLREGDHTLARILLNDADKWVKSCKEYFETMDPGVNRQIEGSMLILHGMRKVLTTKDEGVLIEGINYVKHGRDELNKLPKSDSFAQLVQLADSILQATKYDEEHDSLGIKRLPFNPFG
ncbi:hypothetical protein ACKAV7_007661 [Fusarium commune]